MLVDRVVAGGERDDLSEPAKKGRRMVGGGVLGEMEESVDVVEVERERVKVGRVRANISIV